MNSNTNSIIIPRNNFLKTQHEALGFAAAGFTGEKTLSSSQKANFSISCFKGVLGTHLYKGNSSGYQGIIS